MTHRQLLLDLRGRASFSRADFLPSAANSAALAAIEGWRDWPSRALLLTGPAGSGRTHLLRIWAEDAGAATPPAADLAAALPSLLAAPGPVALDDADALAGTAAGQEALFHLLNHARAAAQPLLLTARDTPGSWGLNLADLESRLLALPMARLGRPDDALLLMALAKLCDDRQLAVPPDVLSYLVPRMERSLRSAGAVADAMDNLAVTRQRRVTRALASEALAALDSAARNG